VSEGLLRIAVVGHTNTGKTSLLRTLTRDESFGEVSDHPAVTRHVEGQHLLVGSRAVAELYDTPGLEDSIGLFEHLRGLRDDPRTEGIVTIESFLAGEGARERFAQEAKAIRQVIASDIALYVIDARERVLGKHTDELAILAWCSRPIVPVLNFIATDEARTATWREHLARVALHAVAEFDTVVFDEQDEARLYEKMRTLVDAHRATLDALIEDRVRERRETLRAAAAMVGDLLIDAAACVEIAPAGDQAACNAAMDRLRERVRRREQRMLGRMLELFRFSERDLEASELPIADGRWGIDPFDPEALRQLGIKTGSAAAAGATVGLGLDLALAGLSLGTGTAIGAAVGALWGAAGREGRRLVDWARGSTEVRCNDQTLQVLELRQLALVRTLLRRGHGSVSALRVPDAKKAGEHKALHRALRRARAHPDWCLDGAASSDTERRALHAELVRGLIDELSHD
jgi:hypothetical protein